jgi:hypothetical protein
VGVSSKMGDTKAVGGVGMVLVLERGWVGAKGGESSGRTLLV